MPDSWNNKHEQCPTNAQRVKVQMNRKFFLCRYKLSPLKYTISKFETFGVKIGDVTGVQSYAFCPEKMVFKSHGQKAKMSRDVT